MARTSGNKSKKNWEEKLKPADWWSFFTQVLVSMPKCTRMVNRARVVMGVPHVNRSTSESA